MKWPGVCRRKKTPAHFSRSRSPSSIACHPARASAGMSGTMSRPSFSLLMRSILFERDNDVCRLVRQRAGRRSARRPGGGRQQLRASRTAPARHVDDALALRGGTSRSRCRRASRSHTACRLRRAARARRRQSAPWTRRCSRRSASSSAICSVRSAAQVDRRSGNSSSDAVLSERRARRRRPARQRRHERSVADQDGADQPVVAHDQLLVDAARRLGVADDLVVFLDGSLRPITATSSPATLSFVDEPRTRVEGVGSAPRQPIGEDLRLLPQRRDEPVELAAMLGAFADRVDTFLPGHARSSPTRMPRLTSSPAAWASWTLGRMPAATTTMSQASVEPSAKHDARHALGRRAAPSCCRPVRMCSPICSSCRCRMRLAGGSSCVVHDVRRQVDDVNVEAVVRRVRERLRCRAARRQSRPPCARRARAPACARSRRSCETRTRRPSASRRAPRALDRRQQRPAAGRDAPACRTARSTPLDPEDLRATESRRCDAVAGVEPDAVGRDTTTAD